MPNWHTHFHIVVRIFELKVSKSQWILEILHVEFFYIKAVFDLTMIADKN